MILQPPRAFQTTSTVQGLVGTGTCARIRCTMEAAQPSMAGGRNAAANSSTPMMPWMASWELLRLFGR